MAGSPAAVTTRVKHQASRTGENVAGRVNSLRWPIPVPCSQASSAVEWDSAARHAVRGQRALIPRLLAERDTELAYAAEQLASTPAE